MTQETIKALSDHELEQILEWGERERNERSVTRKRETIAKIKRLAGEMGISVSIAGRKGRPRKTPRP